MRKIEANMLNALRTGKNWTEGNTSVFNGSVFLHGNRIAFTKDAPDDQMLHADLETLKAWPTNTTRSRLRALGFNVKGSEVLGRR